MNLKEYNIIFEKFITNIQEAVRVIASNKVRTLLTALGIIFGVASVITMLAIGNGAEKEILSQLKLVGVNNIVITSLYDNEQEESDNEVEENELSEKKKFSKGLDLADAKSIEKHIPSVKIVSPEIIMDTYTIVNGRQSSIKLTGITSKHFEASNINIGSGVNFSRKQEQNALPVCIIGKKIAQKSFVGKEALNNYIKVKDVWLKIVGIVEEKIISEKAQENLAIRDINQDIFIPINTFLVRFKNRKIMTLSDRRSYRSNQNTKTSKSNYHQLDKLTVQVNNSNQLKATAEVISKMLVRKHNGQTDFQIKIPVNLLKQQQKTKQVFNIVLSLIAGISLLIGGIGIMNIMLASVLERTKEIGIIRAIGASKQDVILQFLSESILISIGGGIIGIILGIISSIVLEEITGIETVLSLNSIILSFFVSTAIGLIFGISPAKSAANKSPIEAMRHE
jgi:putative ABC transport system permease protein